MEQDSQIEDVIKNIITLLRENNEPDWSKFLNKLRLEYINIETRSEAVKNIVSIYKGGMGSFSDLVLQKNMKMLIEENNKLATLKHELYNACLKYCNEEGINIS